MMARAVAGKHREGSMDVDRFDDRGMSAARAGLIFCGEVLADHVPSSGARNIRGWLHNIQLWIVHTVVAGSHNYRMGSWGC